MKPSAPSSCWSARNREAVEYFIQNGGYFSISTGRALPAFARYAKDLPCNAPCVIANGAATADVSAFNLMGLKSPAVDRLIDVVLATKTRDELTIATKALG